MLDEKLLWTCPICKAKHDNPVEHCKRCQCNLGKIVQVRTTAFQLAMEGKVRMSKALINHDQLESLITPLPEGHILGPGFLMSSPPDPVENFDC